ncbi:MAG: hypothetical protein WC882_03645 [Candidatus Gracilibacteria bacterium]
MAETAEELHLFAVDDETPNRIMASRVATSAQFIPHICPDGTEFMAAIQAHLSQSQQPPRGIALLDGMVAPGSHGVELVQTLDEAGYLVRRNQILERGQVDRAFLLAFLYSGGIDSTMTSLLQKQLNGRLWTGLMLKPTMLNKVFPYLKVLVLNNDPAAVQAALEYFDTKTQAFLDTIDQ